MDAATTATGINEKLLAFFEAQAGSLPGDQQLRRKAAEHFAAKGIPSRRVEDYKYLNLELLLKKDFGTQAQASRTFTKPDIEKFLPVRETYLAVVLNGIFSPGLSSLEGLPAGITISDLDAAQDHEAYKTNYAQLAVSESDPFIALNTMLIRGGLFVHVAKNVQLERPLQILYLGATREAAIIQARLLFVAEQNAEASFIETFVSEGETKTFTNALGEVVVSQNAKIDHYRMQLEDANGHLLSTVQSRSDKHSLYNTYTFSFGGALVRNNLVNVLAQPETETHLYGLYLPGGTQVMDNHTVVDHTVPNCMSNELYKGVISDKAIAVFNGKIFVRPDAQKTNAYQTNKNVLMSDDATVNTKPQLEIYADDVKCSHGTSTGQMDEQALFYLRARGIGQDSARRLLVHAFAEEVVNKVKLESLRLYIEERITALLG